MTSTLMMLALVAWYVATAAVAACEGNWPRVLYWLAAAQINLAVLWMTRR